MNMLLISFMLGLLPTHIENQRTVTLNMENNVTMDTTLKQVLDERKARWEEKAPPELVKIYREGVEDVEKSNLTKSAKQVGETAPDFTLSNALGKSVSLYKQLEKGPVVLTWYRGGWCPYCNLTLHHLQESLPDFRAEEANLIALTPELPDRSLSTKEKHQLEFEVLSDVGNKVARDYGIVFKLTDEVAASYQKAFDLHAYNGDNSDELPLAATYVIDTDGVIKFAFLDPEYRNRAEPSEILEVLKKLKSQ